MKEQASKLLVVIIFHIYGIHLLFFYDFFQMSDFIYDCHRYVMQCEQKLIVSDLIIEMINQKIAFMFVTILLLL